MDDGGVQLVNHRGRIDNRLSHSCDFSGDAKMVSQDKSPDRGYD
jgi:hypothetical protein